MTCHRQCDLEYPPHLCSCFGFDAYGDVSVLLCALEQYVTALCLQLHKRMSNMFNGNKR